MGGGGGEGGELSESVKKGKDVANFKANVKNIQVGEGLLKSRAFLLNKQNQLNVTEVICSWSLS